ncbi:hypothetical protein LWC34_21250 [Kibdelosporangium philippinense]|uniref:Uncharacterized protein n=1 Tax=Kibdelosporangium philippinense TaxID=211113 RepID=A0ABS8ZF70_9PSEU|nr:hypothetical protein [Kibdelosporangium philippinense]MCE7005336.1 hypothetical protein [Kibdelosporangium philippinense]
MNVVALAGSVTQLVCHPRLPLVAGLAAERPAVHVWDCTDLRLLGIIGADSVVYADDDYGQDRVLRKPAVAWHPERPLALVTIENCVLESRSPPPTCIWRSARTVSGYGHRRRHRATSTPGGRAQMFSTSLPKPLAQAQDGTPEPPYTRPVGWWPCCAATKARPCASSPNLTRQCFAAH